MPFHLIAFERKRVNWPRPVRQMCSFPRSVGVGANRVWARVWKLATSGDTDQSNQVWQK